jgi:hypothetical protein
MNHKQRRGISDASLAEVFTALRGALLPSVIATVLILGISMLLLDKGSENINATRFLSGRHTWAWVGLAGVAALLFPHFAADMVGDFGKRLADLAEFWRTGPFWRRALVLVFLLLIIGACAVSILFGTWICCFVLAFFSNLSEELQSH